MFHIYELCIVIHTITNLFSECGEGFSFYDGDSCYAVATANNYENSITACEILGGWLVTIDTATENSLLLDNVFESGKTYWIGYNDRQSEGNFEWVHDTGSTYTNWRSGEPNNSGGEDCAYTSTSFGGEWNDEKCTDSRTPICEQSLNTRYPTAAPSLTPTAPSAKPSPVPTLQPTSPSSQPSLSPTSPTAVPSTTFPTSAPSIMPLNLSFVNISYQISGTCSSASVYVRCGTCDSNFNMLHDYAQTETKTDCNNDWENCFPEQSRVVDASLYPCCRAYVSGSYDYGCRNLNPVNFFSPEQVTDMSCDRIQATFTVHVDDVVDVVDQHDASEDNYEATMSEIEATVILLPFAVVFIGIMLYYLDPVRRHDLYMYQYIGRKLGGRMIDPLTDILYIISTPFASTTVLGWYILFTFLQGAIFSLPYSVQVSKNMIKIIVDNAAPVLRRMKLLAEDSSSLMSIIFTPLNIRIDSMKVLLLHVLWMLSRMLLLIVLVAGALAVFLISYGVGIILYSSGLIVFFNIRLGISSSISHAKEVELFNSAGAPTSSESKQGRYIRWMSYALLEVCILQETILESFPQLILCTYNMSVVGWSTVGIFCVLMDGYNILDFLLNIQSRIRDNGAPGQLPDRKIPEMHGNLMLCVDSDVDSEQLIKFKDCNEIQHYLYPYKFPTASFLSVLTAIVDCLPALFMLSIIALPSILFGLCIAETDDDDMFSDDPMTESNYAICTVGMTTCVLSLFLAMGMCSQPNGILPGAIYGTLGIIYIFVLSTSVSYN